MPELKLTALKAKHGDSLLLRHRDTNILIDGGARGVYKKFLRPFLESMPGGSSGPPDIHLMMVSHIDSDHIAGILDLTSHLIDTGNAGAPIVNIQEAWHNSFSDMLAGDLVGPADKVKEASVELAGVSQTDSLIAQSMPDTDLVLASVGQGRRLRNELKTLEIDVNRHFDDDVVLSGKRAQPWKRNGLTLTVVGPGQKELDKLRKAWKKQLPKILKKESEKKAKTAAASLDRSVFNLASIVVIAQAGNTRMLLTGDARGDMILDWLPETKDGGSTHFDVMKLPHHGSDRNVTPDFFKRVTADHYLVSGDGKHGNPEPEMFEMLFTARPDLNYKIHMTYSPDELKQHSEFSSHGKAARLDEVLAPPGRFDVLKWPADNQEHIDISI